VIGGATGADGLLRLPHRPVKGGRTLNGYPRQPNPFGNIHVIGARALMLVRVTKYDRPCYDWLEIHDFVTAWFRGHQGRYTRVLKTPYGSASSPQPPREVKVTRIEDNHVRITWSKPTVPREQQYLDRAIGFRVYRRISNDGLNDRPWFPGATLSPNTFECVDDIYWYSRGNRFAVSAIGGGSGDHQGGHPVLGGELRGRSSIKAQDRLIRLP